MNIELLLQEISAISKKYDLINQKTGGYFNVFKIANIDTDEVTICRVIYELISPTGSHYQGITYLKLFVERVLKIEMSESELESATVYREFSIDENRRIDIVIRTKELFIPIEVKIYAGDQQSQCYDYYQKAINSNVFYLTRFGDAPSEYSANGLTSTVDKYKEVTAISFADEILDWLDACLEQKETIKIAPIREVILQLSSVIRSFTNQMEDEKEMEITRTILQSTKTLKSALDIEKTMLVVKALVMKNLFDSLYNEFEKLGRTVDIYEESDISDFYKSNIRTYPCMSIPLKELSQNLWATFNIEIADYLYYHFSFANVQNEIIEVSKVKKSYTKEYDIFYNAVKNTIGTEGHKTKNTFLWEYIMNGNGQRFDFKKFSDSCVNLVINYDDEAKRIAELLDGYISAVLALI